MGIELVIGLFIGIALMGMGYIIRTKRVLPIFAGLGDTWAPVNKEKLGNRVGILFIVLGIIAILTSVFAIWFGSAAVKISGILALIDVILIIISIGADRMGY